MDPPKSFFGLPEHILKPEEHKAWLEQHPATNGFWSEDDIDEFLADLDRWRGRRGRVERTVAWAVEQYDRLLRRLAR